MARDRGDGGGGRYTRTVALNGARGVITAHDAPASRHLVVEITPSLLSALMPLLARLRQLFDLDAEPTVIDKHLSQGGLGALVRRRPGLRLPGVIDGWEAVLRALVVGRAAKRVLEALGDVIETGDDALARLTPTAKQVVAAGERQLVALGVSKRSAGSLVAIATELTAGSLGLSPGADVDETRRALLLIDGVGERLATMIAGRALGWPDAFYSSDPILVARAEAWRPWRGYAALQLEAKAARVGACSPERVVSGLRVAKALVVFGSAR